MNKTISENNRKFNFLINVLYFIVIAVILYLAFKYLAKWLAPFIVGFILAALVQKPARKIAEKTKIPQKTCSVIGVLLLVVLLALIIFGLIMLLIHNFDKITFFVTSLIDNLRYAFTGVSQKVSPWLSDFQKATGIQVGGNYENLTNKIFEIAKLPDLLMKTLQSVFSGIAPLFLNTVVTIVAGCFIAADYKKVTGFLWSLIPKRHRKTAAGIKEFFFQTVLKLIRAYATLMLITFAELSLGLFLLRIANPIGIAALIAIIDILPVLGTGTVMIPWGIIELLLGNTLKGISLLIIYVIITIIRNILEPKIVGNHIGLHPLVTLTALIVGLKALGIVGMIAFPITILILRDLYAKGVITLPNFVRDNQS